jgi:citrate synthase
MATEICKELILDDDNSVHLGTTDVLKVSETEEQNVNLYDTFYDVNEIPREQFATNDVKRGLRNADGTGVLAGITNVSDVHGYVMVDGVRTPDAGILTFRGYDLYDIIGINPNSPSAKNNAEGVEAPRRFRYEEVAYLLLMGKLPTRAQLDRFIATIDSQRELPEDFVASMIMQNAGSDLMNVLARSVLTLYNYDAHAEERTPAHEIHTALSIISRLPRIMVLAYYAKRARYNHESMIMHRFLEGQSTAETILSMLRIDRHFSPEEAQMLDVMLCLHAEHGGGNNSTFATRVLSSADTDPYSAYASAIGALKGFRHGGANHKVRAMHNDMKQHIAYSKWDDEGAVADYLRSVVRREAYDKTGLVYGMGHAVYTISDPRAVVCKHFAGELARGTEFEQEYRLLQTIEAVSPEVVAAEKGLGKTLCANVDMYSGFVYSMMGIPEDLYTPLFACARMAGWAAHRFEEIVSGKRIIRPAYKHAGSLSREYKSLEDRD